MPLPYNSNLKSFSRTLRKNMTDCEQKLWQKIRKKQLLGVQFYRQKPIGPYILDFYAVSPKIAIELDGGHHYLASQREEDLKRDVYLKSLAIEVLRFDNLSVITNCDAIVESIINTINKLQINPLSEEKR